MQFQVQVAGRLARRRATILRLESRTLQEGVAWGSKVIYENYVINQFILQVVAVFKDDPTNQSFLQGLVAKRVSLGRYTLYQSSFSRGFI